MSGTLEPIRRQDGRLYRPRKIRTFILGGDGNEQVLVLGTHDITLATELATAEVRAHDSGYVPVNPEQGWWHQGIRDHEPWFEDDPQRGAAGVLFRDIMEVGDDR